MEHLAVTLVHVAFAVWQLALALIRLTLFAAFVAAHGVSALARLTWRASRGSRLAAS